MKKIALKVLTALLIAALTLPVTSCKKTEPDVNEDPLPENIDVLQNDDVEDDVEIQDPDVNFEEYYNKLGELITKYSAEIETLDYRDRITHFLDALCEGNTELIDVYLYGWGHEDYGDAKMTYEISDIVESDSPYSQYVLSTTLTLSVSESKCKTFPVGVYKYTLNVWRIPDPCYISIEPLDDEVITSDEPKIRNALTFSRNYAVYGGGIWNLEEQDFSKREHLVKHSLLSINPVTIITRDELYKHMEERFGLYQESFPEIEEYLAPFYDEEKEAYIFDCSHGFTPPRYKVSDVIKTDKGCKIVWSLFSDYSRVEMVASITYTYEENENSNVMRLVDIEKKIIKNVPVISYSP